VIVFRGVGCLNGKSTDLRGLALSSLAGLFELLGRHPAMNGWAMFKE
jgi:hypothetical protein